MFVENYNRYREDPFNIIARLGLIGFNCIINGCVKNDLPWQFFIKKPEIIFQNLIGSKLLEVVNNYKLAKEKNIVFADFHMHTIFSHDSLTYFEDLVKRAYKKGLRVIAITDHDVFSFPYYKDRLKKMKENGEIGEDFILIPGEEVGSAQGHIVALFIKHRIERGLSVEETIKEIHRQGGIAILPHLTLYSSGVGLVAATMVAADGVEIRNGANFLPLNFFREISQKKGWFYSPVFSNSDTHLSTGIGLYVNKIFIDKKKYSVNDIKKAIMLGKVQPYTPKNIYYRYPYYVNLFKWYFFPFMLYYNVKLNTERILSKITFGNVKFWINYDSMIYDFGNIIFIPRAVNKIKTGEYGGNIKLDTVEWNRGPFVLSWNRSKQGYYLKFDFKMEF